MFRVASRVVCWKRVHMVEVFVGNEFLIKRTHHKTVIAVNLDVHIHRTISFAVLVCFGLGLCWIGSSP